MRVRWIRFFGPLIALAIVGGASTWAAAASRFAEYLIPTASSYPDGIAAGPDGNLWFTESAVNKIGRITTGGIITEFLVPTASSVPIGITTGPDPQLWPQEAFQCAVPGQMCR